MNNNRDLVKYEYVQGNVLWSPVRYTAGPYSPKKDARNIIVFTKSAVRNRPREIFTGVICHNTRVSLTRVCSFNRSVCYKNKLIRLSFNAAGNNILSLMLIQITTQLFGF